MENKFRILKIALNALLMILLMYKSLLTAAVWLQRQYSLSLGEKPEKIQCCSVLQDFLLRLRLCSRSSVLVLFLHLFLFAEEVSA